MQANVLQEAMWNPSFSCLIPTPVNKIGINSRFRSSISGTVLFAFFDLNVGYYTAVTSRQDYFPPCKYFPKSSHTVARPGAL